MEHQVPEWLKLTLGKTGWMLAGVLLTLFAFWCYRQYGYEVALRMYLKAHQENPADIKAVERLFPRATLTLTGGSKDVGSIRCRFRGGGEIDIYFDAEGRIIDIHPTFAASNPWVLRLLHRGEIFTVQETIPLPDDDGKIPDIPDE